MLRCPSVAPAREGRAGAALGAGAGVSGQQADEEDQEAGERHHHQAAHLRAGSFLSVYKIRFIFTLCLLILCVCVCVFAATAGEDRPGEHAGTGAGGAGQPALEADGQAGG